MEYWTPAQAGSVAKAVLHLDNQGISYYLPRMETRAGARVMFPGWIFIWVTEGWRRVLGTRGIRRVIFWGDMPARIPEREIDWLRSLEGPDGVVPMVRLKAGDRVRIDSGTFEGIQAVVDECLSSGNCWVLADLMGRKTRVLVNERALSAA